MKRTLSTLALTAVVAGSLVTPGAAAPKERSYVLSATSSLPTNLVQQVQQAGGRVSKTIPEIGAAVVTSSDPNFGKNATKITGVRSVVPSVKVQWIDPSLETVTGAAVGDPPASGSDDPFFDLQWGHDAVDAPQAWDRGAFGKGVRVAVLDSGIDADHPDLAPNLNRGLSTSFVDGEGYDVDPKVASSHGTHVAGTIAAADNNVGVIGVAPQAELVAVKVLSEKNGSGSFEGVAAGIVYAANIDADVINMSLGGTIPGHNYCDEDGVCVNGSEVAELVNLLKRATTYAYQQDTTVIASAGNSAFDRDRDKDQIVLPADLPNVLTISATGPEGWAVDQTTDLDTLAYYTNYGQSNIDFAAPGGDVDFDLRPGGAANRATWPTCTVAGVTNECWAFDLVFSTDNNGWSWKAGTSMAAPHASGVAALIIGQNGGSMKPSQVESALRASVDDLGKPGNDDYYGAGRVNAYKAVR